MNNIKILAAGDTILKTKNGENPFKYVSDYFLRSDIVILNLETCLIIKNKKYPNIKEKSVLLGTFQEDLNWLLKYKDKLLFTLANNHIMDYGNEGYNDTINFLQKNEFKFCPIDSFLDFSIKNIDFRIYSLFQGIDNDFQKKVLNESYNFDEKFINIISIHWGAAHIVSPSLYQINSANSFFKRGVNIILGCHSHTPQAVKIINGKICAFSLGNFNMTNFSTPLKNINKITFMLEINLLNKSIINFNQIPIQINENIQPFVNNSLKEHIRKLNNFFEIEMNFPQKIRYAISYKFHFSANFIVKNMVGGWIPRIKKYGIKHFFMFLKSLFSLGFIKALLLMPFHKLSKMTKLSDKINSLKYLK